MDDRAHSVMLKSRAASVSAEKSSSPSFLIVNRGSHAERVRRPRRADPPIQRTKVDPLDRHFTIGCFSNNQPLHVALCGSEL